MNGVIVIKQYRKQYKTVETQGLVSLFPLLTEQTYFNKAILFLLSVSTFPLLPIGVFLSIFTVAMQKHPLQAENNKLSVTNANIRKVTFMSDFTPTCGNYVQLHHATFHHVPNFINICPNLLKKREMALKNPEIILGTLREHYYPSLGTE